MAAELQSDQPIRDTQVVLLSFHVDYWDQLGWHDRFSSHEFTTREEEYAARSGTDTVYTPATLVNGTFVDADHDAVQHAIVRAAASAHAVVSLARLPSGKVRVSATHLPNADAVLFLAVAEDGLVTDVKHGENEGRRLQHSGVVRKLVQLKSGKGAELTADTALTPAKEWDLNNTRVVAFAQDIVSGRVLGIVQVQWNALK
jgi:hypothetical protein